MNEINAAQRKEARGSSGIGRSLNKIKIVTAAEAEAEKGRLRGFGIAEQRKAIVDGLADIKIKGQCRLDKEQIMSILLTNQYLDTLNNLQIKKGIIRFSSKPDGVENIRTQILSTLKAK